MAHYRISVVDRNVSFSCGDDQMMLMAMEGCGAKAIKIGCRGGGCGLCKVRILEGDYSTRRMSRAHISEEEQARGFALACRVQPRSDLLVESDHCDRETAEANA